MLRASPRVPLICAPASASAASIDSIPSNATTGRAWWKRTLLTRIARSSSPTSSVAPALKRSSAKSVSGFTMTCPLLPCARAMCPTRRAGTHDVVAKIDRRLGPLDLRRERHQGSNCRGGAPLAADHASEIAWRHRQLDDGLALPCALGHPDRLRAIRQRAGDDFDDVASAAQSASAPSTFALCASVDRSELPRDRL